MTLGNKIAELRKEKGMTQEALANALGVSNQAVSKWEANQSCPDIQLLPQLADFFCVSMYYYYSASEFIKIEEIGESFGRINVLLFPKRDDLAASSARSNS